MQTTLSNSVRGPGHLGQQATKNAVLCAIILLVAAELLFQPKFATYQNLVNVSRAAAILALVSVGQMFVIFVRGFDLSIGGVMAFSSIAVASALAQFGTDDSVALTAVVAVAVALTTGIVLGAVNGLAVSLLRVHSFIVTLGMSSIVVGIALWLTDGVPIYGIPKSFISGMGRATWAGVPSFVWIAALVVGLLAVMLNQSYIGKYIKAAGRDERAAELSGINTRVYVVLAYAICGACAAFASLLLTTQLGSGQGSIGTVYPFQSIAVCIIGGVSLMGGKGSLSNVVIAAIFMQLLNNGFELMRVPSPLQALVAGAVVIFVAVMNLGRKD